MFPGKFITQKKIRMMTWTCNNFEGHYPVGRALIVTADNIELAIQLVEQELKTHGLPQKIKPEQLIPYPTHHRYVRVLCNGDH